MRQGSVLDDVLSSFFVFAPKSVMLVFTASFLACRAKRIVQLSSGGGL